VKGRSHDGGIDGDCVIPFVGVRVAFQAKRFAPQNAIGTQLMQQFKGSIGAYERGIFITTSSFTPGAKEIAEGAGVKIILIDGQTLSKSMMEKDLGVKTIPVTTSKIDESFFQNLGRQG
jgi:restriction system protein